VQTELIQDLSQIKDTLLELGRSVINIEAEAVAKLSARIDDDFASACQILLACEGRIVVCGIGKSGHIGAKIAATFASTGSPAFFVHAAEASHGDLGMFKSNDVVVALSYSGSSDEVLTLVPGIKRLGIPLVTLCGEPNSALMILPDRIPGDGSDADCYYTFKMSW